MNDIICRMNEETKNEEIKLIHLNFGREIRVHEEISSAYLEFQSVIIDPSFLNND